MKKLLFLIIFIGAGYKLYDVNITSTELLPVYVESQNFGYSVNFPKDPTRHYKEVNHPNFGPIGLEIFGVNHQKSSYMVQATKYLQNGFQAPETTEDLAKVYSADQLDKYDMVSKRKIKVEGVPAYRFMFVEKNGTSKLNSIVFIKDNLGINMVAFPSEGNELEAEKFLTSFQFIN